MRHHRLEVIRAFLPPCPPCPRMCPTLLRRNSDRPRAGPHCPTALPSLLSWVRPGKGRPRSRAVIPVTNLTYGPTQRETGHCACSTQSCATWSISSLMFPSRRRHQSADARGGPGTSTQTARNASCYAHPPSPYAPDAWQGDGPPPGRRPSRLRPIGTPPAPTLPPAGQPSSGRPSSRTGGPLPLQVPVHRSLALLIGRFTETSRVALPRWTLILAMRPSPGLRIHKAPGRRSQPHQDSARTAP